MMPAAIIPLFYDTEDRRKGNSNINYAFLIYSFITGKMAYIHVVKF